MSSVNVPINPMAGPLVASAPVPASIVLARTPGYATKQGSRVYTLPQHIPVGPNGIKPKHIGLWSTLGGLNAPILIWSYTTPAIANSYLCPLDGVQLDLSTPMAHYSTVHLTPTTPPDMWSPYGMNGYDIIGLPVVQGKPRCTCSPTDLWNYGCPSARGLTCRVVSMQEGLFKALTRGKSKWP